MLMTPGLAWFFIAFKLGAGCAMGLFAALACYRSRITVGLLLRGAILGGIAFVVASGVAGWAGSHAAFKYEPVICSCSSCIAGVLAGIRLRSQRSKISSATLT
jgi:hypothetical protein